MTWTPPANGPQGGMENERTRRALGSLTKYTWAYADLSTDLPTNGVEGRHVVRRDQDRVYVDTGSAYVRTGWYSTTGRTGCTLRRAANQSITNATPTNVSWDTEDYDSDGYIAVTATTVTIPSGLGGLYSVSYRGSLANFPGARGFMGMTVAGVIYRSVFTGDTEGHASTIRPLAAADTIVADVYQTSGGALNFTGRLDVYRIGP